MVDVGLGVRGGDERGFELAAGQVHAACEHLPEEAGEAPRVAPLRVLVVVDRARVEEELVGRIEADLAILADISVRPDQSRCVVSQPRGRVRLRDPYHHIASVVLCDRLDEASGLARDAPIELGMAAAAG